MMPGDLAVDREELMTLKTSSRPLTYALPRMQQPPSRAGLWLLLLVPPRDVSYRISVFVHPSGAEVKPDDPQFRAQHLAGDFSFWRAHHLLPGQTAGAFIPITPTLRNSAHSETDFELTLVPKALPARRGATGHSHEHGGHGSQLGPLEFQSVVLQLNGNGAPNIRLGGVDPHGR